MIEFKNKHQGERCVLMGNGPSLNDTDLSLLKNETTIGLNKIHLLFPKIDWQPTYITSYIREVVAQARDAYMDLKMPLFISQDGKDLVEDRKYPTYFYGPNRRFSFSMDPAKDVSVGFTVTYVAMQLAFYMGFKKVILVGMDHNFKYEGEPSKWQVLEKECPGRHFASNYFEAGQKWESPNPKMIELHYSLAKGVYEYCKREIVDCTVGGSLQVFRKARLEDELKL
jgi:hypothetical protein